MENLLKIEQVIAIIDRKLQLANGDSLLGRMFGIPVACS
jgi:hypothetical protein